ncbi:hypothetical protein QT381_06370 [Galbitalea sp. SE-J8]|uniref:hypothetical protein n=1 Tax=Galbitalea sp. SE-J8 TaxID=3054952 RepID=UPI00259CD63A|nr:hypothetical protein [Galbitalea sp. SE-J8]MDM4762627.1 hypothetical protein [Galbitalea sp. SE-J8]
MAAPSYEDQCNGLLDAKTRSVYAAEGLSLTSDAYEEKVAAEDGPMGEFVRLGGLACGWGEAGGELLALYAYGPITDDQAAQNREVIIAKGSESMSDGWYERFTHYDGYPGGFAFGNGNWAYALDNGGGDLLDQVVANAPKF